MTYSFRTNGNYIDFVHTDNTSLRAESVLRSLHNTSRCVSWSLSDDTTRISFIVDDIMVENFLVSEIDFDGTAMNSQDDFETGITAMFTGLAGGSTGGSSFRAYAGNLTQSGTSAPTDTELENTLSGGAVVWTRQNEGVYIGTSTGSFTSGKVFIPNGNDWSGDGLFFIPISAGGAIVGYLTITVSDANRIFVQVWNAAADANVDWSTLGTTSNFPVEVRVYP